MSVRDESMEFQRWYWDKYHDISPAVPSKIYNEYLDYKAEHRERNKQYSLLFLLMAGVVLIQVVYTMNMFLLLLIGGLVMGVLFKLLGKSEVPVHNDDVDENVECKSDDHINVKVNDCFQDYELEVNNLKVLFDVKEKVVRDLISERFKPPQMTYDKFIGMVDSCNVYFYNQSNTIEDIISLAAEDTPRIRNELDDMVNNMKRILTQVEDLTDELLITNNPVEDNSVDVLVEDMECLIESIKTY